MELQGQEMWQQGFIPAQGSGQGHSRDPSSSQGGGGAISDLLIRDNIELASPWRGHSRGHIPNPSTPALSILLPNGIIPKTPGAAFPLTKSPFSRQCQFVEAKNTPGERINLMNLLLEEEKC